MDLAEQTGRLKEIVTTALAAEAIVREQAALLATGGSVGAGRHPSRAEQLGLVRARCDASAPAARLKQSQPVIDAAAHAASIER